MSRLHAGQSLVNVPGVPQLTKREQRLAAAKREAEGKPKLLGNPAAYGRDQPVAPPSPPRQRAATMDKRVPEDASKSIEGMLRSTSMEGRGRERKNHWTKQRKVELQAQEAKNHPPTSP
jgi:hypothetical protein